jgi:hypothetical protein
MINESVFKNKPKTAFCQVKSVNCFKNFAPAVTGSGFYCKEQFFFLSKKNDRPQ